MIMNPIHLTIELPKINPEVKDKWLVALRSGDYKQTQGGLKDTEERGGGMCCLGVLCDMYQKETGKGEWNISNLDSSVVRFEGERYYAPQDVRAWAGISSETIAPSATLISPELGTGIIALNEILGYLNDDRDYSFTDIADFIEKNL